MSTVLVVGGTTEAQRASGRLEAEGFRVVVSVATGLGERYTQGREVVSGSKDGRALAEEVRRCGAGAVLDCTHPFAVDATRSARAAAAESGIPYLRFTRLPSGEDGVECVADWDDAVGLLRRSGSRSLLTIGVRHLEPFAAAGLDFAARVLPLPDSIDRCVRLGLRPENIIAAFPPHDVEFNRACIRKTAAKVVVMKDSGDEGGTPEKIAAAAAEGARAVMVLRPRAEAGISDIDELVASLNQALIP
ncbi:MAG: precorrin-6A reductase [Thermoleophilia bacterium]